MQSVTVVQRHFTTRYHTDPAGSQSTTGAKSSRLQAVCVKGKVQVGQQRL